MELKDALSNGDVHRFQYYVFDLLYLNGRDTRNLPLLQRKALLADVLAANAPKTQGQRILFSEHFTMTDDSFLRQVCSLQLEGVVSKRADAPYQDSRLIHDDMGGRHEPSNLRVHSCGRYFVLRLSRLA